MYCDQPAYNDECTIETAVKAFLEAKTPLAGVNWHCGIPDSPGYPYAVISLLPPGSGTNECCWTRYDEQLRIRIYYRGKLSGLVSIVKSVNSFLKGATLHSQLGKARFRVPALPSFGELSDDVHLSQMVFPVNIYQLV